MGYPLFEAWLFLYTFCLLLYSLLLPPDEGVSFHIFWAIGVSFSNCKLWSFSQLKPWWRSCNTGLISEEIELRWLLVYTQEADSSETHVSFFFFLSSVLLHMFILLHMYVLLNMYVLCVDGKNMTYQTFVLLSSVLLHCISYRSKCITNWTHNCKPATHTLVTNNWNHKEKVGNIMVIFI